MQDRANRMNRLFRESYSPEGPESIDDHQLWHLRWHLRDEHNITLKLESPGMTKKILMSVSRATPSPSTASARSRRKRRRKTSVASSDSTEASPAPFTLPSSVGPAQVSANYDKGVLRINLAKKAEAKPKQIRERWQREDTRSQAPRKAA